MRCDSLDEQTSLLSLFGNRALYLTYPVQAQSMSRNCTAFNTAIVLVLYTYLCRTDGHYYTVLHTVEILS